MSQADVPYYSLDDALRLPRAIGDNYAFQPTRPLAVAAAMDMQPASSTFRMLGGSAIAYGLTEGGYNADRIQVTPLARRILEPTEEGEDLAGRREALLRPRVLREFLTKYDGNKLPREDIATNVLASMGVPREASPRTLTLILESAKSVGFLREIRGTSYVNLDASDVRVASAPQSSSIGRLESDDTDDTYLSVDPPPIPTRRGDVVKIENRRVFITHGSNKAFLDPLKELLTFGELEPVIAVERESVSQPVPDKVMNDMRSCSAAIIHVEGERRLLDQDGTPQVVLNANVLIEIGAAMALYGRRFILLVHEGIDLPSNLQGLYEVRYDGDKLDGNATIRLLKAIKDIKNHPTPVLMA